MSSSKRLIDENGLRVDGRRWNELRPLKIEVGILSNVDGSARVIQGRTHVIVGVYGPRELLTKHLSSPDKAVVRCRYRMAPFSVEERKSPAPSRREIELSKVIREALEPAILVEEFPRTTIDIFIEVLEADGGTRCASITAASVALADAGIPMRDLVTSCAVGKADGQLIIDLSDFEDKYGEADVPVACMPNKGIITLLQMDGQLSIEEFDKLMQLAIKACKRINEIQRKALIDGFGETKNVLIEV
ncbi:MAG: exosome complex exonuclease Rrp41 [Candidatus Methanomethylicia archaeon]|nr:exosome complex exonuclease Rrp41 [Candidatus Methanomethylicia archaeon]MCX8169038.1 exosome complex exonuclease Rrp41 [Candidatus Methanomethylicia archaeon]MDW7988770.1 exosome complex exonuclease Rrp41 [Nitrososphaerota archaeon]